MKHGTKIIDDPTSPDGERWFMSKKDWSDERYKLAVMARFRCEGCRSPHPVPYNEYGQAHHIYGRGGGRHEDRALVPLQRIETEPNLARWRWRRNLRWTCMIGHERLEKMSTKSYRQFLREQFCQCGLMKL